MTAARSEVRPGRMILVEYEGDERLWHERMVVRATTPTIFGRVTGGPPTRATDLWWVLTPDGDLYPEEISVPPLRAMMLLGEAHEALEETATPPGSYRRQHRIHRFGAGRAVPLASPLVFLRAAREAMEAESGEGAATTGRTGGAIDEDGVDATALRDEGGGGDEGDERDLDARVLTVRRGGDGRRARSFKDTVAELIETTWDGWPVQGPRTLLWCAQHIAEFDHHPLAHHTRFRQIAGLQHFDAGVQVHEMAMRVLDFAVTFDQLQVAELACLEVVVRQAQLIELKYRNKVLSNQTASATDVSTLELDDHLYLGTGRTRGLLMVDPRLEEYVATELQRETAAAKERRKMREERALQRPAPGDDAGKGAGKKK